MEKSNKILLAGESYCNDDQVYGNKGLCSALVETLPEYSILNACRSGDSNSESLIRLLREIDYSFDYVVYVQTDWMRNYYHELDGSNLNNFSKKHNLDYKSYTVEEWVDSQRDSLYTLLASLQKYFHLDVILIGGLSRVDRDIAEKYGLTKSVKNYFSLIGEDSIDTEEYSIFRNEIIDSWPIKTDGWVVAADNAMKKLDFMENSKWFFDNCHPVTNLQLKMAEEIKKLL